jgi:hypothetical protein
MSQKQRVFDMLAKKPAIKLSATRKVNMSIADDLQSALNELYDKRVDMENAALDLRRVAMELGDYSTAIVALEGKIERMGALLDENARQLGIDLEEIPVGVEFVEIINSYVFDDAKRYTEAVKNLNV